MDRYFPTIAKSPSNSLKIVDKDGHSASFKPYSVPAVDYDTGRKGKYQPPQNLSKLSSSALTKHLLKTLSDESNPITHSDIGERADYVISVSTGHQVSEGTTNRRKYLEDRAKKLKIQMKDKASTRSDPQVLDNVRVYIDGFLSGTTDIEMKRIISGAGGQNVATASSATHILTSQQLSGSKTHQLLTKKSRRMVHVVTPQWVLDSIKAGKRRPEREYSVISNKTTKNLFDMLQK